MEAVNFILFLCFTCHLFFVFILVVRVTGSLIKCTLAGYCDAAVSYCKFYYGDPRFCFNEAWFRCVYTGSRTGRLGFKRFYFLVKHKGSPRGCFGDFYTRNVLISYDFIFIKSEREVVFMYLVARRDRR